MLGCRAPSGALPSIAPHIFLWEGGAGSRVIRPLGLTVLCEWLVPEATFIACCKYEKTSANGRSEQTSWWDVKMSMGRVWIIMGKE